MKWKAFPYPCKDFEYTSARLKKAWAALHAGDVEPWPSSAPLLAAWIDYHAGRFEHAERSGLAAGLAGYSVANKAACMQAVYLDNPADKQARLVEVAERCTRQQQEQPDNPAAYYWHAYALGRHAQELSVLSALTKGIGSKIRASLESTLRLAPRHADAHIAFGVFHAEIIGQVGALVAAVTYGASRDAALSHFHEALALNPGSAIARIEYARAMMLLDGRAKATEAFSLCREAAASSPHDATERLDIERARQEIAA